MFKHDTQNQSNKTKGETVDMNTTNLDKQILFTNNNVLLTKREGRTGRISEMLFSAFS